MNVLSTSDRADTDALYGVDFGSSHIQAVSYTDEGVDSSTILTYGVSTDRTRASSSDQTALFGQERWVDFPFEADEVAADAKERYVVSASGGKQGLGAGATPPVAAPVGALPATGLPVLLPVAALLLGGAAVAVRRRR